MGNRVNELKKLKRRQHKNIIALVFCILSLIIFLISFLSNFLGWNVRTSAVIRLIAGVLLLIGSSIGFWLAIGDKDQSIETKLEFSLVIMASVGIGINLMVALPRA